jgi:glutamate racemase
MFGIFDSGVGGLSVYRLLEKKFPKADFIYLGDTAHFPYGEKSDKAIKEYALKNAKFLISKGAKNIIIACHTASAFAGEYLKLKESDLGVKVYDVITPTIKKIANTDIKHLGVIGTRGTINSRTYAKSLEKFNIKVTSQSCPLLVSLIEEGWVGKPETEAILSHYLLPLKNKKIDALVLSCTHYSLLKKDIAKIMGSDVEIIDPAQVLALELEAKVGLLEEEGDKKEFFVTDYPSKFLELSAVFLRKSIEVKKMRIKNN